MRLFILSCMAIALMGCKSKKNAMTMDIKPDQPETTKITAEIGNYDTTSAAIEIKNVKIEGNKMLIDVAYSGGCQDHSFQVVGSPVIAKSMPPIRSVRLIHFNNNDNCRAYIMKTLEVDIKALSDRQKAGSVIYLTLEGWEERLTYTFE